MNRRTFLVQAGMIVGTAAAPRIGRAAAENAPGRTITLGVMGVNGRGTGLAAALAARPGCLVTHLCDVDQKAIERCQAALAKRTADKSAAAPQAVGDFRRILDDKAVDALVIAAPDHWHGPATILACAAGKHVYCEKPASHNGQEGQWMIAAARKHRRHVQLGTQRRSSPKIAEAIQRMKEGEIGRVLFARGWINSTRPSIGKKAPSTPPPHVDFTLWQGPAPEQPFREYLIHYHWHWFWHWGTGELGNNGIHALDVCRWGLGVDYPTRVVCGGGKFHFDDDQETPDTQLATFHFGDRAIHWEHRTWHRRGFEGQAFGSAFYGEKGTLVVGDDQYVIHDMAGKQLAAVPLGSYESTHQENFLTAIREDKPLAAEIEHGVKSTTLCHLGNIAYRTGQTVEFDPKTRQTVGSPAAAKLWTREYRPGWEPKV